MRVICCYSPSLNHSVSSNASRRSVASFALVLIKGLLFICNTFFSHFCTWHSLEWPPHDNIRESVMCGCLMRFHLPCVLAMRQRLCSHNKRGNLMLSLFKVSYFMSWHPLKPPPPPSTSPVKLLLRSGSAGLHEPNESGRMLRRGSPQPFRQIVLNETEIKRHSLGQPAAFEPVYPSEPNFIMSR